MTDPFCFGYPYTPAKGKTDTSEQAANALIKPMTIQNQVFYEFENHPYGKTADEIAILLNMHKSLGVLTIRPRVTELVKQDRLEDTGLRRKNSSGRNAIVWRAKK
jgi:hypothetical protein